MRILIIEDDAELLDIEKMILTEEGHEVLTAEHGQRAIQVLASSAPPGLILLDLMMPRMNGWDFRRWQQEQASVAGIPVVIVSAVAADAPAETLQPAGHLRKPFSCGQLIDTVAGFAAPAAGNAMAATPWTVPSTGGSWSPAGQPIVPAN